MVAIHILFNMTSTRTLLKLSTTRELQPFLGLHTHKRLLLMGSEGYVEVVCVLYCVDIAHNRPERPNKIHSVSALLSS